MRSFTVPLPTLFAGFVAVLVGYASSAAIIWQAAAAGANARQIAGWMTALAFAMGVSTLALSGWRKVPVLTVRSTPGPPCWSAACRGDPPEAVGVFIFANALIVLCGVTGLFARLMKKSFPIRLAAAMLAGILLRFGLQAFAGFRDHLLLCGGVAARLL